MIRSHSESCSQIFCFQLQLNNYPSFVDIFVQIQIELCMLSEEASALDVYFLAEVFLTCLSPQ